MPKRILQGIVVSDKGVKTIIVQVERRLRHPLYKKFIKKSKKFMAHDENGRAKIGDVVNIQECRPLSKRKCWELLDIARVARGSIAGDADANIASNTNENVANITEGQAS